MNDKIYGNGNNSGPASSGATAPSMDRLARSAHDGIDAASGAVHPGIDRAAAGAHKVVESADQMANHAVDALERAGVKSEEVLDAGAHYLREHPLLTLGLAVGAGYLLSRFLTPR